MDFLGYHPLYRRLSLDHHFYLDIGKGESDETEWWAARRSAKGDIPLLSRLKPNMSRLIPAHQLLFSLNLTSAERRQTEDSRLTPLNSSSVESIMNFGFENPAHKYTWSGVLPPCLSADLSSASVDVDDWVRSAGIDWIICPGRAKLYNQIHAYVHWTEVTHF